MSEQINIDGNTYTLGATVGPISGTGGSTSYFYNNLVGGQTYYFVVVAYNYSGFSGYAGPVSVYNPPNEQREPIQAFAWDWPYSPVYTTSLPSSFTSTNTNNLFPLSNEINVVDIWNKVNPSNIERNQNPGASAPPEPVVPYAISSTTNGGYVGIVNVQKNLIAGQTYTYSFYHNISDGVTGLSYRIIVDPSNAGGIPMKQILPTSDTTYSSDPSGGEKGLSYGTGLTGWQRFAINLIPGSTQTNLKIYIVSKTFDNAGVSAYIGGPCLNIGDTPQNFTSTGVVVDWEGNCAAQGYTYDDTAWLNESASRGWTYITPMVNFSGMFARNPSYTTGWTLSPIVQRAMKLVKQLPNKKRAILPVYYFSEAPWFQYQDGISFDHGVTYTFYNDLFTTTQTQKTFPTLWPVAGICMAKDSFSNLIQSFAATGATVDYLISNMELFSNYGSFSIAGYTAFKEVIVGLTQYSNSYLGLTSFASWMSSEGATISNIGFQDQITLGNDYVVWEGIQRAYINRALEEIYSPISSYYPNATKLEYEWSYISDGDPRDGAPDINGHPQWFKYLFGNAAAPQIYGWMGGIAGGAFGICGADPTYIYFEGGGNTLPAKDAWTSFLMGVQTIRSAKRGSSTTPITPWIASVRFAGDEIGAYPGGSADAPQVGFADMSVGFNPWQGLTINTTPGNSAYYYEMIKHVALHGVKAFPYWNSSSFTNYELPKVAGTNIQANTRFAGDTGYVRDMNDLNETLLEINERLGGFTLTTADDSRISWLAPYVASGAPGLNGTTWWWRITANPRYEVLVDGNTLLSSTGPGMWLGTTGPTLGVDISSSPVLGSM